MDEILLFGMQAPREAMLISFFSVQQNLLSVGLPIESGKIFLHIVDHFTESRL